MSSHPAMRPCGGRSLLLRARREPPAGTRAPAPHRLRQATVRGSFRGSVVATASVENCRVALRQGCALDVQFVAHQTCRSIICVGEGENRVANELWTLQLV